MHVGLTAVLVQCFRSHAVQVARNGDKPDAKHVGKFDEIRKGILVHGNAIPGFK
ncbi:hypothetical protein D1872_344120 [compost metagenome]